MRLHCLTSDNGEVPVRRLTATGTLTSGSAVVTALADTSLLAGALQVSGAGIPLGTIVQSIDSATQLTLTGAATVSGSPDLTFTLEPLSLAEAKLHLKQEVSDDDLLIAGLISTARRYCEVALRQALLTQSWVLYLDAFPTAGGYYNRAIREIWPSLGGLPAGLGFYPGMVANSTGVIDIPLPPLKSITSVQYYDLAGTLQNFDSANYNASLGTPARIQPAYSKVWPISRPTIDSVLITFVAGYGDTADKVPDNIKSAMKLALGHWYENREWVAGGNGFASVPNTVDLLLGISEHGFYA
jgi:hypothetical protein